MDSIYIRLDMFIGNNVYLNFCASTMLYNSKLMVRYLSEIYHTNNDQWPLLLTWFNFNPSMDK